MQTNYEEGFEAFMKSAGLWDELVTAGTKMDWHEGLVESASAIKRSLGGKADDAAEAAAKAKDKLKAKPKVRKSVAKDPRMPTYG